MHSLDREGVVTVLIVIAVVASIGLVSATITDVVGTESHFDSRWNGPGGSDGPVINPNVTGTPGGGPPDVPGPVLDLSICMTILQGTPAILGVLLAVTGLLYGIYRRYNSATSMLAGTGLVPVVWGGYFLLTNCGGGGGPGPGPDGPGPVLPDGDGSILTGVTIPPSVAAGVFGLAMLVGIAVAISVTRGDEAMEPEPAEDSTTALDGAAFAQAARRARERIEDANVPVDNAVYRAWLEMTSLLETPNPRATAPREFADAAIAAGFDEEDVRELTELFNEVRYGGKRPDLRADRAIEILRNVEEGYDDANDPTGEDDDRTPD